jgi:hypothetical protein
VADRARMLGQPGHRLRSPRLMATLCAMEPAVAGAASAPPIWARSSGSI